MSYLVNKKKQIKANTTTDPSAQTISTSYTAISSSVLDLEEFEAGADIAYKSMFYVDTGVSASNKPAFLHIKLQKSNDNFSSNIVDITGCQTSISGDDLESQYLYNSVSLLFIIESFDSRYLRLVARSYSTTTKGYLHVQDYFDGSAGQNAKLNPTTIAIEL